MRLIECILFGRPCTAAAAAPIAHRRPRKLTRPCPPQPDPVTASNDSFFQSVVLRKRPARAPAAPSPPAPPVPVTRPAYTPSFPRGLCYLAGVAPSDRAAAMLTLGSYPSVAALLSSWLFQPSGIWLLASKRGLYHAVTVPSPDTIPFTLGQT